MKLTPALLVLLGVTTLWSCTQNQTSDDTPSEDTVAKFNPLEEIHGIFKNKIAHYDSVSVESTDSTYTFFAIPKSEEYDHEKELYGAYTIDKKSIKYGDVNNDGLEDVLVSYSYTPHLDNNTLIYFKVLLQKDNKLAEAGEIFGGGRCEGPILELTSVKNGIISFNGSEFADGDPCCCPTIKKNYAYKLENNTIVEVK